MMYQTIRLAEHALDNHKTQHYAVLTLSRSQKSNSLNALMIEELTDALFLLGKKNHLRFLILEGTGKNFCAGADLEWMKASKNLSYEENIEDAGKLQKMLTLLSTLPFLTICLCNGSVFGGGVGLVSCCDLVFAKEHTRFCLSEIRLGLFPAIIMPFLYKKMSLQTLRYYSLSAKIFSEQEAQRYGLVDQVFPEIGFKEKLHQELSELLKASPASVIPIKSLFRHLHEGKRDLEHFCVEKIADARSSHSGQRGLDAFLQKKTPEWVVSLPESFTVEWDR